MGSQVRVLYRAPQKSLEATRVSRLFLLQFLRFSLIFPLIVSSGRYGLNKLFHPLCAVSLHLLRDVSVNIQRKRSGSVSEVFLHGLNVVAAFDASNRVSVAQVVKASGRRAYFFHNALKAVIHRAIGQIAARLIGKDKPVFLPCRASGYHCIGSSTAMVVPLSELSSTQTEPPWRSAISHTRESPSPAPPYSRLRDLSTRKKGWKILR